MSEDFKFDLKAKKVRIPDGILLGWLQQFAKMVNEKPFTLEEFDNWTEQGRPNSATIVKRFGSWRKALSVIGIQDVRVRPRRYSPEELKEHLEEVWKQLGYPPGNKKIGKFGRRISEHPYKQWWGSLPEACRAISRFHEGKITLNELLAGKPGCPTALLWVGSFSGFRIKSGMTMAAASCRSTIQHRKS